jgi:hypothetical protein
MRNLPCREAFVFAATPPKQKRAKLCLRDAKVFVNGLAGFFYQGQDGGKARFGTRSREPPKVLD